MQDGAIFGEVDLVATEHGVNMLTKARLRGELPKELEGFVGDAVLGVIQIDASRFGVQGVAAGGVVGEELTDFGLAHHDRMLFKGLPCG